MKELILVLFTISFAFFMLNNCSDSLNPTMTNIEKGQQLQKLKKPKPPQNDTRIEYFKFGNKILFDDYEEQNLDASQHEVVDISGELNVSYHIASSIDIDKIKVEMRYDADANSVKGEYSWLEKDTELIYPDPYYDEEIFDVVVNEPIQISLIDQLASYNYPSGKEPPLDHYIIYISVFNTDGTPTTLLVKNAYVWITGAKDRSNQRLIVDEIQPFTFSPNKNKVSPIVTIKVSVVDGEFTSPAYIDGLWEGLVYGYIDNVFNRVYSDDKGYLTIKGDSFRKNSSGLVRFIVSNIKSETGVYDPGNNNLGNWPISRPVHEEDYP